MDLPWFFCHITDNCNYFFQFVCMLWEKVDQGGLSLQRDQYVNKSIEKDKVCPANSTFLFAGTFVHIIFSIQYFHKKYVTNAPNTK